MLQISRNGCGGLVLCGSLDSAFHLWTLRKAEWTGGLPRRSISGSVRLTKSPAVGGGGGRLAEETIWMSGLAAAAAAARYLLFSVSPKIYCNRSRSKSSRSCSSLIPFDCESCACNSARKIRDLLSSFHILSKPCCRIFMQQNQPKLAELFWSPVATITAYVGDDSRRSRDALPPRL